MSIRNRRSLFGCLLFAAAIAATPLAGARAPALLPGETPHDYRDPNFDYFVSGNPRLPRAARTGFLLALMGGGGRVDAAFAAIAAHAGRGHIVILRAVSDDSFDPEDGDYGASFVRDWGPVASAETFTFHNRAAAFDPRVVRALRSADGIFIAGGDQANYIRYWKGTPVQEALNAHVRANRPIGGSSAGLAVLGHYSYTAFDGGSLESKVALADPSCPCVTLEDDFLHFRGLENVITDSHFSARRRLGRLIVFLARLNRDHPPGGIFGIGIDEHTALLVGGDGVGRIAPGSLGNAWIVTLPGQLPGDTGGQPLTIGAVRIARVDAAGAIDVRRHAVIHPAAETVDAIDRGVARASSFATGILKREIVPPDED